MIGGIIAAIVVVIIVIIVVSMMFSGGDDQPQQTGIVPQPNVTAPSAQYNGMVKGAAPQSEVRVTNTPIAIGADTPPAGWILVGEGARSSDWPRIYCPKDFLWAEDVSGVLTCKKMMLGAPTVFGEKAAVFGTCPAGHVLVNGKCVPN